MPGWYEIAFGHKMNWACGYVLEEQRLRVFKNRMLQMMMM